MADPRAHLAELSVRPAETFDPGAMTYQLRRLRLHGMIERQPNSHRYHVTDSGFRTALFFTRTYNHLLRADLAAALPGRQSARTHLKQAFNALDARLTAEITQLALVA